MSYFCMSWDHRALDGAYAAQFLKALKDSLESAYERPARLPSRPRRLRERARAAGDAARAGAGRRARRRAAAARAPAGLHARPALGAEADLPMGEAWYRAQGIDVARTDRGGKLTYHGPGQLVGYPIMRVDDVVGARARDGAGDRRARSARRAWSRAPATDEGVDFTGVWVEDRKIASIGIHLQRGVTTHGFAVNVDNDLQPFEWVVACGLPEVADDVAVPGAAGAGRLPCFRKRMAYAFAQELGRRQRLVSAARLGLDAAGTLAARERRRAPARDAVPRQPGRDGRRARSSATRPSRGAAASRSGSRSRRPAARSTASCRDADQGREPAHGLPGGGLPQRRRVLGARHRHVHDPRRHLHAPLRLLQRQDRQADVERPAGAAARRPLDREAGPAARGHHERRPRRPARLRRLGLVRRHPLRAHAGAGLQGRGPHARLPRRGDAARARHRRAPRRLQPQRRGRAAAVPDRPPRRRLGALQARAAQRQGDGRRRGRHQVRLHGRPRRDARRARRRVRPSCARRACRS